MADPQFLRAKGLAFEAGLSVVEQPEPKCTAYKVRRGTSALHETTDLDDLVGWLEAWLEYVH